MQVEAQDTIAQHRPRHEAYLKEALRLRDKYKDQIAILVGFEAEWIRPSYAALIKELEEDANVDFFLGSVHHVHEIPTDYDKPMYHEARDAAGGSDERIFEDYYDSQHEMLLTVVPTVVAHFDVIRLLSDEPNQDPANMPGVWAKILRNLQLIQAQGGLLEINSSAIRKGLKEPYPVRRICQVRPAVFTSTVSLLIFDQEFIAIGGRFTLSDDSHGIAQVGLNYQRSIEYLKSLGVENVYYLERDVSDSRSALLQKPAPVAEMNVNAYPRTL